MDLHHLRAATRDHILRSTIDPDPDLQKSKQRDAALKHAADQAEREAYLRSLEIPPPTPSPSSPSSGRLKKFQRQQKTKRSK